MFCPMCGTQVDDGAATCSSCRSELPTKDDGSNPWILSSPSSLKIDRLLFFCDSVAVIITGLIVVHALVWNRPLSGVTPLLIVGIPLLVFGQVWMLIALNARRPKPSERRGPFNRLGLSGEGSTFFFEGLSKRERYMAFGTFIAGWLAGATAFPSISNGGPGTPTTGCPWPLVNHGVRTCVSQSAYLAAGVGLQRFAVGVLLGFFSIHAASSLSEIRLRRS